MHTRDKSSFTFSCFATPLAIASKHHKIVAQALCPPIGPMKCYNVSFVDLENMLDHICIGHFLPTLKDKSLTTKRTQECCIVHAFAHFWKNHGLENIIKEAMYDVTTLIDLYFTTYHKWFTICHLQMKTVNLISPCNQI